MQEITNTNHRVESKENKFTGLGKLYVWSVVFEPLLFFVVFSQSVSGVGGGLSRLLQLSVIISFVTIKLINHRTINLPSPLDPLNRMYSYYLILAILAGCLGLLTGSYQLVGQYTDTIVASNLYQILNSPSTRPFFEYFIALYYFFYFAVLPRYLLFSKQGIDYFFKIFFIMFHVSFLVGVIDYLLELFFRYEWIPRHLSDGRHVGLRFHGLAGEPRDAFVFLIFGLTMLALKGIWTGKRKLNVFFVISIFTAAILTQSASGLIGLTFAGILIIIFYMPKVSVKTVLIGIGTLFILSIVVTIGIVSSPRILNYVDAFAILYDNLKTNTEVAPIIKTAMNNIYPIWERWLQIIEFDVMPLFFGTGFGSASVVNNNYMHLNKLSNPNANVIRSIYETGIIGTYVLIIAFLTPIKKIYISKKIYIRLTLFMLLLLGMFFAHRSATPFIFLGLIIVVLLKKSPHSLITQTEDATKSRSKMPNNDYND